MSGGKLSRQFHLPAESHQMTITSDEMSVPTIGTSALADVTKFATTVIAPNGGSCVSTG